MNEEVFAIRATRCLKALTGKRRSGKTGMSMKITQILKSTAAAVVVAGALLLAPASANARVFVSVGIAPPAIPVYEQPLAPGYGYIWTPGYWAYGDDGYYWVDGAWVYPPYVDALWTPGYWGWGDGGYFWTPGYWGRSIGYYGGINYGFGYFGTGFYGGYWNGGHFFYNGAYNHIGFHNGFVYNHPVAGFDGRPGGAAFARNDGNGFNRGAENFNRGAGVNGNTFANRSAGGNVVNNASRPAYNGAETRSFTSGNAYAQRGNASGYAAPQTRAYNGGAQIQSQARSYTGGGNFGGGAQAQARSYSGGNAGGGGFHGGGGGGSRGGGRR